MDEQKTNEPLTFEQRERIRRELADSEAMWSSRPTAVEPKPLNTSGLVPVEYKCLVRLDPVEEKRGSIYIPEQAKERQQAAETYATLIAVGGNAFEDWKGSIPQPGDRVIVSKYSGQPPKAGDISDLYRLCVDKDICAIIRA